MKNSSKEIDFGIMENAELSELEALSEKVFPAGSADKKKILEMSIRKYDTRKTDSPPVDTVSGSEPYRPHTLRKIAAAAAVCALIAGGIAGVAVLLHRRGTSQVTETEETTVETPTEETTVPQEETSQSKKKSHEELIEDCKNEFLETDGKNATDIYYSEYDVNGDGIPEVFFQYHSPDPVFKDDVCELYAYKGEKYERLSVKSENIWVNPDERDGIILVKANSEPITYLVFNVSSSSNELELLKNFRCTSEDGTETYTIDGVSCSQTEWKTELEAIKPQNEIWKDNLKKLL